jgi:hypothetical protein
MEHAAELLIGQRCVLGATVKQIAPVREEELRTETRSRCGCSASR